VAQFGYLGTTITNQNLIQEEIKRTLNSGNAGYYSVQNLLSYHLLSKNIKIRTYKTIILAVVLYGCEICSLALREEGFAQPPIPWVPVALSPRVKRPGREADHSPPASAEAKKMWIYTSTPLYAFKA
jgi:hypothetical protein